MITGHGWWYLARGSGLVATGVLTAVMAFGLTFSTRLFGRTVAPAWLLELHRFLGALSLVVTGIHVGALMMDQYVHFGVADVLVPMATSWHPLAVAYGIVAMWLLVAVEASSLVRRHLPKRLWRSVHLASFGCFIAAVGHGLAAGTDARGVIVEICLLVAVATVLFLTLVRVLTERSATRAGRVRQQPVRTTA